MGELSWSFVGLSISVVVVLVVDGQVQESCDRQDRGGRTNSSNSLCAKPLRVANSKVRLSKTCLQHHNLYHLLSIPQSCL